MKKTTKVILLSLLVFPGVSHLVLKKYLIAITFMCCSTYLLLSLIKELHNKTQHLMDSIIRGKISIEISVIYQTFIDQGALKNSNFITISYLFVNIRTMAAFDAYKIANKSAKNSTD